MKKFFLAATLTAFAGTSTAQLAEVDEQIAQNLQAAITNSGFDCAQVINVEPVGTEGARITCVLVKDEEAIAAYIFSVTADGLSITLEDS